MDEILRVQISGKFNGRDANLSVALEAESAFEIEDMETSGPNSSPSQSQSPQSDESRNSSSPSETSQTENPATETTESEENGQADESAGNAGLDQLFPEDEEVEEEDEGFDIEQLPPLRTSSNQFAVAKTIAESDRGLSNQEILGILNEKEPDKDWSIDSVKSALHTLSGKDIVASGSRNTEGRAIYTLTDIGLATIQYEND